MTAYTIEELGITADEITSKEGGVIFYDVREEPFRVYGLHDYKNQPVFRRIPEDVTVSPDIHERTRLTTGGRVRFSTSSPFVAIHVIYNGADPCTAMSPTAVRGLDLYTKYAGRDTWCATYCCMKTGETDFLSGLKMIHGDKNDDGEYEVMLNLPTAAGVKALYIGLAPDASLSRRADYRVENPVLYYGSSIMSGCHASRPGMIFQSIISRRLDADFINLGFTDSCSAEDAIIDYLATLTCSVFVFDYDYNAPTEEDFAAAHEKAYRKFRAAHPQTPVIFLTRPDFLLWDTEDMRRRDIVWRTYQNALTRGEKVLFIDGYSLLAGELCEECTTDGMHPNDLGMVRMADVIGKAVDFALSM